MLAQAVAVCHGEVGAHPRRHADFVLAGGQPADEVLRMGVLTGLQRLQDLPLEQLLIHLDVADRSTGLRSQILLHHGPVRRLQHWLLLLGCGLLLRHLVQELLLAQLQLVAVRLLAVLLQ